jgi:hypothetical protein
MQGQAGESISEQPYTAITVECWVYHSKQHKATWAANCAVLYKPEITAVSIDIYWSIINRINKNYTTLHYTTIHYTPEWSYCEHFSKFIGPRRNMMCQKSCNKGYDTFWRPILYDFFLRFLFLTLWIRVFYAEPKIKVILYIIAKQPPGLWSRSWESVKTYWLRLRTQSKILTRYYNPKALTATVTTRFIYLNTG